MTQESNVPEFEQIVANPNVALPKKPKGLSLAGAAVFLQHETGTISEPEENL